MLNNNRGRTAHILLLVLLTVFLFGVFKLFIMRFETGDVYPTYSSLRSDPLGTKAFYDGLDNLQDISVTRNYKSLTKLGDNQEVTVFLFGIPSESLNYVHEEVIQSFERLIRKGGRLVITLFPEKRKNGDDDSHERDNKKNTGEKSRSRTLTERWGFGLGKKQASVDSGKDMSASQVFAGDSHGLPDSLSWHSSLYFKNTDAQWKAFYASDGDTVIMKRKLGNGTIVLAADSYFVSNEAMRRERHSGLLAWLVGTNRTVVFDETHFGIQERPGIASLGRKYRLHGVFAGLLFLAILFVWKNSFILVPSSDSGSVRGRGDRSTGKDSITGVISLLRRNIAPRQILGACFQEWVRTFQHKQTELTEEMKQIETIVEAEKKQPVRHRDPVKAYKSISKILSERKYV